VKRETRLLRRSRQNESVRYNLVLPRPHKIAGPRRGRPTRGAVYERLQIQIRELHDKLGGLPSPAEAEGIWRGIWLEEAHHSTALEGNTLVLKQVEQLLSEGRAVGSKTLAEYMEVRGYADAANWVYGQAIDSGDWSSGELLSLSELRHVHRLAIAPVWEVAPHPQASDGERPGSFREHDLEPFPGGMQPPSWTQVPSLVAQWLTDTQKLLSRGQRADLDPEALASLHARFERIHPFLDGNGRAGRLALNLMLVRLGYAPAIIYKRDRARYLAALGRADHGDHGPLGELLARAILDNLHRFVVSAVAGPAQLVPLPALATRQISANTLRVAAARGRLKASKAHDGSWRSTRDWVDEYLASRYTRSGVTRTPARSTPASRPAARRSRGRGSSPGASAGTP
jgi:fido (protein-threonine AMPylation protein)